MDASPRLNPDYAGVTMPINMAAPSFKVLEEADDYQLEVGAGDASASWYLRSKDGSFALDLDKWRKLVEGNAGQPIKLTVSTLNDGQWRGWLPIDIYINGDTIDPWIAYRLIYPGYELWNRMGIYQRQLSSYLQEPIIENKDIELQCVNCHSFAKGDAQTMMLHVRGPQGGTVIRREGHDVKVNPRCPALPNGAVYPSWHPSGRYIAFASNDIKQFFHLAGDKPIEVSDMWADLMVYDVEADKAFTGPCVSTEEWLETFPSWTPAGDEIYFCRALPRNDLYYDSIRYDLCKVSVDLATQTFGEPEVVIAASQEGKSVSFPRVSPDGRWLLYTLSDYGNFSIWHKESDLWLLDLVTGTTRPVDEVNSDNVESYHTWSSTGRWIVFSSKRLDGLWGRPYFAHFDPATGTFDKPFALPQPQADFYDYFTRSYNIPEFITGRVEPISPEVVVNP